MASNGNEHDIRVLNDLIETTIDSADGYAQAAADANARRFADIFSRRAQERRRAVTMLQDKVRALGGTPEDEGTLLASAHRSFVKLREKLGGEDKAIVEEVERGEDHIKHKYEDALRDDELSAVAREAVTAAFASVKSGHDEMSALKHSFSG